MDFNQYAQIGMALDTGIASELPCSVARLG